MSCSLRKWFCDLSWMQQGVLMSAFRNVDGAHQEGPYKILVRGVRAACIKSARSEGSFNARRPDHKKLLEAASDFVNYGNQLPLHFVTHLVHAAEVIGYTHPDKVTSFVWENIYITLVHSMHLNTETKDQFLRRLKDDPEQVSREEVFDDACYLTSRYGDGTGTVNEQLNLKSLTT